MSGAQSEFPARCHCHFCVRDIQPIKGRDLDLHCPHCRGTSVEILDSEVSSPSEAAEPSVIHYGVGCDACGVMNFAGMRYHCLQCANFDLCEACYAQRATIHPHHDFESIEVPRLLFHTADVFDMPSAHIVEMASRHSIMHRGRFPSLHHDIVATLEISFEDESETQSGLEDVRVAWWLAGDDRLANVRRLELQSSKWSCPICTEGQEAESRHGWIVGICNDCHDDKNADGSDGHSFHEQCLRQWLLLKNACPVCRRSPVVPTSY